MTHAVTHDDGWQDVARRLADIARDLLSQDSEQTTLDRIAECAVDLLDGCEAAGILVIHHAEISTLAATDNVARACDRLQAELREGPCFDAARDRHRVRRIADLTAASAIWPRFTPRAHELGVGSVMSFLLFTTGTDNLGALNLYSGKPGAFDERSEQVGLMLASHAAVALAAARNDARLLEALRTSRVIGEAIGIIMAQHELDADAAFAVLSRVSQNTNIKLREVADRVAREGHIPGPWLDRRPPA